VDRAHLKQVATAYLANALKLSPKSGRITVRAAPEGRNAVRLEVEYKLMASYYKPGEQPPGTDATLALAREIMEPLGGRTGVRLSNGRSTILHAEFPIGPRPARELDVPGEEIYDWEHQVLDFPRRDIAPAIAPGSLKTGMRVFVCRPEDPDRFRDSMERAGLPTDDRRTALMFGSSLEMLQSKLASLTGPGHKLVCVRDVRLMLEATAQWEPFAILIDLSTSGLDSIEFIETELRSAGLSIPIIGFLNRELSPADGPHLPHQPLGLLELAKRDASLAAVRKALA
jgi:CheY-like chemotaxis protein